MIFGVTHLAMMALIFWMVQNQRATSLLVTRTARGLPGGIHGGKVEFPMTLMRSAQ